MKKIISVLLILTMLFSMAECGNQTEQNSQLSGTVQEEQIAEQTTETGKTLIAYFTWADNTYRKNG